MANNPFAPFDLGQVLGQAEAIKSARSNRAMDELQAKYLGERIQTEQLGRQQATDAARKEDALRVFTGGLQAIYATDKPSALAPRVVGSPRWQESANILGFPGQDFLNTQDLDDNAWRSNTADLLRQLGVNVPQMAQPSTLIGGKEAEALGFRPGTVVERTGAGGYEMAQQPLAPDAGVDQHRPMSQEEMAAWNLPAGTSASMNIRTGKPDVLSRPDKPPNLRPIPASAAQGIIANRTSLGQIDRALEAVDLNKESFGMQNYLGDVIQQRLDPKGVAARALVADIGSLKLHDRSGAAVTAAETPRLKPFIPVATDEPDVIATKLQNFKAELEAMLDESEAFYSEESGYRPLKPRAGALPEGVSEEDVKFTMQKYGVSREEVLQRILSAAAP